MSAAAMAPKRLRAILDRLKNLSVCVVGDAFIDRYWDIDPRLAERSLETFRIAHQAVGTRCYPGGAGNVARNFKALGVGKVSLVTCIGADALGWQLKKELDDLGIDRSGVIERNDRHTPAFIKPLLHEPGKPPVELDRVDLRTRRPTPRDVQKALANAVERRFKRCAALVVIDQVPDAQCGVITASMRRCVAALGRKHPEKIVFADSRKRIEAFKNTVVKPNTREAFATLGMTGAKRTMAQLRQAALALRKRCGRPVFLTLGSRGCLVAEGDCATRVPTFASPKPLDIVGAGDGFTTGAVSALAAGATAIESAFLGNLVASITIQQLGVTGFATQTQLRKRLTEFRNPRGTGR